MVELEKEIDGLIDEGYVPSSVERKKAVLMYFFVGMVMALSKAKVSIYEFYHLKQALGRRMIFFICMIVGIIFIFIPYLRILPVFLFLLFLIIWLVFVKQAWEGSYVIDEDKVMLPFFAGIGGRVLSIFELEITNEEDE